MSNLVTINGKELKVVIDPKTAHYKLQFTSGGELPVELTGLYTSAAVATLDAIKYIERNKNKAEAIKEKQEAAKEKQKAPTTKEV